jgi:putative FmdB family regulatory protein
MPRWDCECQDCGTVREITARNLEELKRTATCPQCGYPMEPLPSAPAFVVKGFSASNGYSK